MVRLFDGRNESLQSALLLCSFSIWFRLALRSIDYRFAWSCYRLRQSSSDEASLDLYSSTIWLRILERGVPSRHEWNVNCILARNVDSLPYNIIVNLSWIFHVASLWLHHYVYLLVKTLRNNREWDETLRFDIWRNFILAMPFLSKSCRDWHIGPAVALGCLLSWASQYNFVIRWTFSWVQGACEFTSYSIAKSALWSAQFIIITNRISIAWVTAEGRSPISRV